MKLELCKVVVKRLKFGEKTEAANGTLTINKEELKALLLEDERLASVDLDLAHPDENTRIMPVKDVVEPRCKLEGPGEVFPGFIGSVETVGMGKTLVLEGMAVLTAGRLVAAQEGIVDMSGPGAEYTPFSKTCNLVVVLTPRDDVKLHEAEHTCRVAGLKAAHYLAASCKPAKIDASETFNFPPLAEAMSAHPGLPKVGYLYMLQSQGLLHDTWVYGVDAKRTLPTLLSPTEIMDGAVISGNCVSACDKNTTYHHVHNPVVTELYARHGKDINFLGMVPTVESTILDGKKRAAMMNLTLSLELGANAVIITEEGYGNPDTDFCLNAKYHEDNGIVAVVISDEAAGIDGKSQGTADSTPELVSFVSTGNVNEMIELPAMKRVIGDASAIANLSGGAAESLRPDGSMHIELQAIIASTCEIGFSAVSCEWI